MNILPTEPSPRPHTDTFLDASPIFFPDQDGVALFVLRTPKLGEGQWDRSWDHAVTIRDTNKVICLQGHLVQGIPIRVLSRAGGEGGD